MDLGIADRVALVTGSSRGIGRATAELLAGEGARVAITYRHDCDAAQAVAELIRSRGGDAIVIAMDLASEASVRDAVSAVAERWGRLDILVNNAVQWASFSTSDAPPFEQLPSAEWRATVRANIEGAFTAMQAVVPYMRIGRWGRIVSISTVVVDDGMRGAAWYGTAKSALHGLTRSLAREVGDDGILVNVVMAGLTLTERVVSRLTGETLEEYASLASTGRLLQPADIAATVAFLASAANTAITGEIVRASGGLALPPRPIRRPVPAPPLVESHPQRGGRRTS